MKGPAIFFTICFAIFAALVFLDEEQAIKKETGVKVMDTDIYVLCDPLTGVHYVASQYKTGGFAVRVDQYGVPIVTKGCNDYANRIDTTSD